MGVSPPVLSFVLSGLEDGDSVVPAGLADSPPAPALPLLPPPVPPATRVGASDEVDVNLVVVAPVLVEEVVKVEVELAKVDVQVVFENKEWDTCVPLA